MFYNIIVPAVCLYIVYISATIIKYLLIDPYIVQRRLKQQSIPGHYIPILGDILKIRHAIKYDLPSNYNNSMFEKYGNTYYSNFGPLVRLSTCDPSIIEYVTTKNVKSYHKAELGRQTIGALLGVDSILFTEDQLHAIHRKAISPVFHYNNLKSMHSNMYDTVMDVCKQWNDSIENSTNQSTNVIMHPVLSSLTLDIISTNAFGLYSAQYKDIRKRLYSVMQSALHAFVERAFNLIGVLQIIREMPLKSKRVITQSRIELQSIIDTVIADRKTGKISAMTENADLLDLLLAAEVDDKVTGNKFKFSNSELYSNAITFVLAGHETTSNLLTWTFANLLRNPQCLHTLQHELDIVLKGQPPIGDKLAQLKYTEYVLMESQRMRNPVEAIIREAVEDNVVVASDGKRIMIHKGCGVVLNFQRLHNDPKYWPNPKQFDPTRFGEYGVGGDIEHTTSNSDGLDAQIAATTTQYTSQRKRIAPCTFLPFSTGRRNCIGQNFALLEAKIILATILQQFNMELIPGHVIEPIFDVNVRVKGGLQVKLTKRPEYHKYQTR